ncbi:MAG: DUF1501 domain-containing protein [Acidimicrobiia bacterium]|nr:DUF1501 domain-containing protein [Acidimicrobiia bacterium]
MSGNVPIWANPFGCPPLTRRQWLREASNGFGLLALSALLAEESRAGSADASTAAPRAKSVIFFFMDGGPSHVDTFDPKPELAKRQGQKIGQSAVSTRSQSTPDRVWLGSPWQFKQQGQSGLWVSDLFPHLARVADELCVIRSMVGQQPLHGQQNLLLHTGRVTGMAPSFGSWVSYGLGKGRENLPNYVVLNNDWIPNGGFENFSSAFLPAFHAATMLRAKGIAMDNIAPADPSALQQRKLALIREQDQVFAATAKEETIDGAIRNYETAFRLQREIPDLADVSRESEATRTLYGLDSPNEYKRYYGLQCLRARRLVESGVRFVEVTCPLTHPNNSPWDQHSNLKKYHEENSLITDQGVAALIQDLKQRGLLDSTVVLWAGEMGRTPHTPKITDEVGRDHHVNGYSIFIAGGGFKRGLAFGSTDEFGNAAVERPTAIHDVHATILHQLGLDHRRLTFRFGGRDVSLTDIHGELIRDILA